MLPATNYLARINQIVGCDVSSSSAKLHFTWNSYDEGRALIQRLRIMQKELRLLKQEINAAVSAINSEFTTARTKLGKSFGAGLAAGFFGRKTMGRVNASQRDSLRRGQMQMVSPYRNLKGAIDGLLATLDSIKGQVELSPTYKIRSDTRARLSFRTRIQSASPAVPSVISAKRYFVYVSETIKGPYSVTQIKSLLETQIITLDTQTCLEGTEEWCRLDELVP